MLGNGLVVYFISGAAGLFTGLVLFLGWMQAKKSLQKLAYDEQLADLTGQSEVPKDGLWTKWNNYWNLLFDNLGIGRKKGGIDILLIWGLAAGLFTIFLKNPLSGIALSSIFLVVAAFFMKNASDKKTEKLNKQLPGFLFALKANVEARNTPEAAFLNIVEDIPEPLYNDVVVVKQGLLASRSFSSSLEEMKKTTNSKDLKFLASCIIQATESGGDIKEQIITIQNILEKQQEISDEIMRGYKTASPVLKLATGLLPGSLIAMFLLDENARDFWFKEPMSWIIFLIIVILYAISVVYTRNQVGKLRKF